MEIIDFSWDLESAGWTYEGKEVHVALSNINFANLDAEENYIYIVCGENFSENNIHYLTFDGKEILAYDKTSGSITWEYDGNIIEVQCEHLENARLYTMESLIMAIAADGQGNTKLIGWRLDGTLAFETAAPPEYKLSYLSSVDKKPTVVCEGSPAQSDKYGRNTWHFSIDTATGELIKSELAH
ncbi:hypothetical protein [Bacillus sp. MUM 13]|uniref:hypothetical protein n=1 Tax=Bacillus sp. MUM 13 TaxID=1678001 RepID=UPI0008F57D83|nr:hypothetical protein [Bacillus sp. MUM 13]OIK13336.1 hypothetical protein BIV59_06150 [Bacillus sp. MUM 13]